MTDELWDIFGGAGASSGHVTKADAPPVLLGDSTTLPAGWQEYQNSLWETLTFQPNINIRLPGAASVGLTLAVQCADVKARDIAKADLILWRRTSGNSWRVVEPAEHPMAKLLARVPNDVQSWTDFWRMTVLHLELTQNAYIMLDIDRQGRLRELIPVPPARVQPLVNGTRIFYEIAATTEFEQGQFGGDYVRVPSERMIHLRGRQANALMGMSSLALGHPLFDLMGAISAYQTGLFQGHGKTPMVFETDRAFGDDGQADAAFRRLKSQLTERTRKMEVSGDPILLEAGLKAKQIAMNAKDSMTGEAFNATVMRVCSLMQCPPHKIFHYESVKYDNQSAADNLYANDVLIPIAKNIEEKLRLSLLDEDKEWDALAFEFDRLPMLAGDPVTLGKVLGDAMARGAIEIDEYRERIPLNLNPLPNAAGQVRLVPVNTAMVDRDGNIIAQTATGQPNNTGESEGLDAGPAADEESDEAKRVARGLRLVAANG